MDLLPRIEIDGASKTIGNSVVLDQIQLTVKPGEMIGLQGVNGSGKTMLLRLISGLIYPTKGHVLIDGKMLGSDLEFPPSIGFLIENPSWGGGAYAAAHPARTDSDSTRPASR